MEIKENEKIFLPLFYLAIIQVFQDVIKKVSLTYTAPKLSELEKKVSKIKTDGERIAFLLEQSKELYGDEYKERLTELIKGKIKEYADVLKNTNIMYSKALQGDKESLSIISGIVNSFLNR